MIDKDLKKRIIHIVLKVVGFLFLFSGFLGIVLPLIPGPILIILGVLILGEEVAISRWVIKRMPKFMQEKLIKLRGKYNFNLEEKK